MLDLYLDTLQEFIVKENEQEIILHIPESMTFTFDRDLILSNFKDVIVKYTFGNVYQEVRCIKK